MVEKQPKKRKNNLQLRLSKPNEIIAEQVKAQYESHYFTGCDWTWFGNYLIKLGIASLKQKMMKGLTHQDRLNEMTKQLQKGTDNGTE